MLNMTPSAKARFHLEDILDIVRNESLYTQRIKEIEKVTEEAEEATKKLTKAKDLDTALSKAKQAETEAVEAFTEARAKAADIINQAEAKAEQIIREAQQDITETNEALNEAKAELSTVRAHITLSTQHHDALREQIQEATFLLNAKQQEGRALTDDIKRRREQLEALLR